MDRIKFKNIDEYIGSFPEETQILLRKVRSTITKAAPDAREIISYGMPAFYQDGTLVYFAAFKNHIGFYPTSSGISAFMEELAEYAGSKGTVRFPFSEPVPFDLITSIVKYRVRENSEKLRAKTVKKSSGK